MRQYFSRRSIVQFLTASIGAAFAQARCSAWGAPTPSRPELIDAHCHVFNATDLPERRFLKIVIAEQYPTQGVARLLELDRQDILDHLINLLIFMVGQGKAASAAVEAAVLQGASPSVARNETPEAATSFAAKSTAAYLEQTPARSAVTADPVRAAILRAGGVDESSRRAGESLDSGAVAERAVASSTDIGAYLRWFALFTLYRYGLVDALAKLYSDQGYLPVLLAPAIIDYSRWLGEEASSSLEDQVAVMSLISRRTSGPAVHGYIGFDPLREVYFRKGILKNGALGLVRSTLTEHGFAGVKLYPPMGFRASGNADDQQFPKAVLDDLGPAVSDELNSALDDLYQLCTSLDAPILVHTAETNGAGPNYANRADPAYWLPVLSKFPTLRLCFAHFGRFSYVSIGAASGSQLPESSWEWVIGRYLKTHPDCKVFVDLSYLTEIFDAADAREKLAATFRQFIAQFDPDVRHIIFGSDWLMVAQDPRAAHYAEAVTSFLRSECRLSSAAIGRILRDNALAFLGLGPADATRSRLLEFYRVHSIPPRLPVL